MHILYLARLVLVQLALKFKLCRFLNTKNADRVCMFCFQILYLRLLYSVLSATFALFLTVEPPLRKRHILSKPDQDLVCRRFKNRVKFVSANSFVCGSYLSLGSFLNRFPLYIIRREKLRFLISQRFSVNFFKEGW